MKAPGIEVQGEHVLQLGRVLPLICTWLSQRESRRAAHVAAHVLVDPQPQPHPLLADRLGTRRTGRWCWQGTAMACPSRGSTRATSVGAAQIGPGLVTHLRGRSDMIMEQPCLWHAAAREGVSHKRQGPAVVHVGVLQPAHGAPAQL